MTELATAVFCENVIKVHAFTVATIPDFLMLSDKFMNRGLLCKCDQSTVHVFTVAGKLATVPKLGYIIETGT